MTRNWLSAVEIGRMQDEATVRWHEGEALSPGLRGGTAGGGASASFRQGSGAECGSGGGGDAAGILRVGEAFLLVMREHRANFELWHEEDKARDPDAADAEIARVKRAIDGLNQRRNDLVEELDVWLLGEMGKQDEGAPLHSETPGMMVDRMSILALKIYHTREEAARVGATEAHRNRNLQRLETLVAQRDDLAGCLDALWVEVKAGRRRFKLYRQMKMYNDPELNPVVYGRTGD